MQTTGKVILNARGVNINGYDCFVNLSKDTNKEIITTGSWNEDDAYHDLVPSVPTFIRVSSAMTKYSPVTLNYQNQTYIYISMNSLAKTYGNFTISSWIYSTAISGISSSMQGWEIRESICTPWKVMSAIWQQSGPKTTYACINNSGSWSQSSDNSNPHYLNKWLYYTETRSGSTFRMFINGSKVFENGSTGNCNYSNFLSLYNYLQNTYCDDLVVIANQALWTSNFTPPSTYLLDSEYAMDLDDVKRRNIIAANVDKKLIIPDDDSLKQY